MPSTTTRALLPRIASGRAGRSASLTLDKWRARQAAGNTCRPCHSAPPSARMDDAVELLLATSQNEFPVVGDDGTFEGLLTRDAIIGVMKEGGAHANVRSAMRTDIPMIGRDTAINESLRIMQAANSSAAAVVDRDKRLVGLMNLETIGELLMLRAAAEDFRFDSLRRHRTRPGG